MNLAERAHRAFAGLQDTICAGLEALDGGATFREDAWTYAPGAGVGEGGGRTRVISGGKVFEKGGVNLSAVTGRLTARLAGHLGVQPQPIYATGLSLVLHPLSPHVPTVHMNVRYLELLGADGHGWFGGGADLTPYYLVEEDARHFHRVLRAACDEHAAGDYPRFKHGCDEYFYLPHRGEARGVGGIFFDYLKDDPEATFAFATAVGAAFLPAYGPIVKRRRDTPWSDAEREWQLLRRGRYVEFNLIHDRGTLFGLETGGRTESILMSLPPVVHWAYDHSPAEGSAEALLLAALRSPRDWLAAGDR